MYIASKTRPYIYLNQEEVNDGVPRNVPLPPISTISESDEVDTTTRIEGDATLIFSENNLPTSCLPSFPNFTYQSHLYTKYYDTIYLNFETSKLDMA